MGGIRSEPAWQAFRLIVLGLVLAAAVVWIGRRGGARALGLMSVAIALLAGAIGVYFLLSYDWNAGAGKFALLQRIGLWVQTQRPAIALPEDINANVAASGLTLYPLPRPGWAALGYKGTLGVAPAGDHPGLVGRPGRADPHDLTRRLAGRGRRLLAMGYLLLRRRLARQRTSRRVLDLLAIAAILSVVVAFWAVVRSPGAVQVLGAVPAGGSAVSRATLWRDGLDLVGDYPFTGSGLRSTMMVYSSYGLLLHVGYILHMHNLFLQIAVEQGVVACLAFMGLLAVAAASVLAATRPGRRTWRFGLAAGAALAALAVHGIVDAGMYASLMLPVLFLPIGFALAADPGRAHCGAKPNRLALGDWANLCGSPV